MFRALMETRRRTVLLTDAIEETLTMIERAERLFGVACNTLLSDGDTGVDVNKEDREINTGERLVRRLVAEHITLNPQHDLGTALALISIVHDVERLGDYAKNLVELNQFNKLYAAEGTYAAEYKETHEMVSPLFDQALEALRASDAAIARRVMARHEQVKAKTDKFLKKVMEDTTGTREAVLYALASRYLRRTSGHLSNVASSVANPLDKISGKNSD